MANVQLDRNIRLYVYCDYMCVVIICVLSRLPPLSRTYMGTLTKTAPREARARVAAALAWAVQSCNPGKDERELEQAGYKNKDGPRVPTTADKRTCQICVGPGLHPAPTGRQAGRWDGERSQRRFKGEEKRLQHHSMCHTARPKAKHTQTPTSEIRC